jgi:histidinol-phosphate aminotransferase
LKTLLPVRDAILRQQRYVPPVEGRAGKLRLDFNENTVGCSRAVLRALAKLTAERLSMYPEYALATRRLARFFGVRADEMVLTNGVDDALHLLCDTFVDPRSRVLLCEPTFSMYRFYAELASAKIASLRYDAAMRFPLDGALAALRPGKTSPRIFFLANPNNPTGTLVPAKALGRMLRAAPRTVIVVDEAYTEFSGLTIIRWIRRYPNLVVLRTFSKAAGLAALRLGCIFANRNIISFLKRAASPFSVNAAALVAAEAAIRDRRAMRRYVAEVTRAREEFARALSRLGITAYPSAANFLLVDFGERGPQLVRKLERRGILLRDRGMEFGRRGFARVSIGTRAEMRRLIRAIEKNW